MPPVLSRSIVPRGPVMTSCRAASREPVHLDPLRFHPSGPQQLPARILDPELIDRDRALHMARHRGNEGLVDLQIGFHEALDAEGLGARLAHLPRSTRSSRRRSWLAAGAGSAGR